MAREIDRRNFSVNKVTRIRETELESIASEVSDRLPGAHRLRIEKFDPSTGNPSMIASESAPSERGNYIQRALDHMQGIRRALGFAATQPAEYVADPNIQETSSGAVAVHLQQQYKSIPIFQAAQAVRFSPDGTLKETAGTTVTVMHEKDVRPKLSVIEGVLIAARYISVPHPEEKTARDQFGQLRKITSVDLTRFVPKVVATFPNKPEQPTVLDPGPFGDKIKAGLIWFPLDNDLRLSWEVIIAMPRYEGQYRTMVDAETGEILYCRQILQSVAIRGNVYRVDGGIPREMTDFPRPLTDYGLPIPGNLPIGFPDSWVTDDSAIGNSVNAHLGDFGNTIQGTIQDGVLTFDPADPVGDEQKVLNIFYYNCFMHDYLYLLGFREADGNFQHDNFGRGGVPTDRVDARAHSGEVWGTANMYTFVDGSSPVMNMGLVGSTNRHTAFDSTVVFHEFTHGLTNRLVGGPMNDRALEAPQSGGMGEGWSDYIACTINETTVAGAWVLDDPGGIRGFPYDSNFPDNFGNIGGGRYTENPVTGEIPVHQIGEIWCAALMEMNRKVGINLGVQLVVDALKLTPANPSFLDARDAILLALDDMLEGGKMSLTEHAATKKGMWECFAKFGMGMGAQTNGASLYGIVASFDTPTVTGGENVQVEVSPSLNIPDNDPIGVSSAATIEASGTIQSVKVALNITHTFIGDLRVELVSPSGQQAILHNRTGGSQHDLIATYDSASDTALANLIGQPAKGTWVLRVKDLAALDLGTLNKWSLELSL
jgi:extracellular elastinolytic metalloproteinase